jgi:hypothetical protein
MQRATLAVLAGGLCLSLASLAGSTFAAVTPLAYYRLGEADPGAGASTMGQNPTMDSAGNFDLTRNGTPTYTTNVSSAAAANVGSTLAMDFAGTSPAPEGDRYNLLPGAALPTPADDWGIEAWVQADTNGAAIVSAMAYNGNSANSGMGLYQFQGNYIGLVGGKAFVGSSPINVGEWVHLAMVTSGGASTFYVNGVSNGTGPQPNPATDQFNIAGRPDNMELFDGRVDEVRVFTFQPGQFSTADLLVNVPEPAAMGLIGFAGLAALRRRR